MNKTQTSTGLSKEGPDSVPKSGSPRLAVGTPLNCLRDSWLLGGVPSLFQQPPTPTHNVVPKVLGCGVGGVLS